MHDSGESDSDESNFHSATQSAVSSEDEGEQTIVRAPVTPRTTITIIPPSSPTIPTDDLDIAGLVFGNHHTIDSQEEQEGASQPVGSPQTQGEAEAGYSPLFNNIWEDRGREEISELLEPPQINTFSDSINEADDNGELLSLPSSPPEHPGPSRQRLRRNENIDPYDQPNLPRGHSDDSSDSILEEGDEDPLLPPEEELDIDYPLKDLKPILDGVFNSPISNENWTEFEEMLEKMIETVRIKAKIPEPKPKLAKMTNKKPNTQDAKFIQKLYKVNRRKAVRLITDPTPSYCQIPKDQVEHHFRKLCEARRTSDDIFTNPPAHRPKLNIKRFGTEEVEKALRNAENTAPGEDRICYRDWLKVDPKCYILTTIFNICLRYCRVPKSWKTSSTILIFKNKGEKDDIGNWRPIALSSTISKLYSKVLANRLSRWLEAHTVLSHCQKGFMPYDGVLEHNYVLEERINQVKKSSRGELCIAWLDYANAFPSVSHSALIEGLKKSGVGSTFVNIVRDLYNGATTQVRTNEGYTEMIDVKRGIKQGDPISGLLFNIAIDAVIRKIQDTKTEHQILAFADDLTPIDRTRHGLQEKLNSINEMSIKIGMPLKPSKCHTLHLKMESPRGARATQFYVGNDQLNIMENGDYVDYLGKPVGFRIIPPAAKLEEFKEKGLAILTSKLAPWQKLDAMKTFVYSAMTHDMRMGTYSKVQWAELDEAFKIEIRKVLSLPDSSTLDYIYGSTTAGAIGIPIAAEESDIFRIDTAFKLLSSKDSIIRELSRKELDDTVIQATRKPTTTATNIQYLNGDMEMLVTAGRGSGGKTTWTDARTTTRRFEGAVAWEKDEDNEDICLKIDDMTLKPLHKRMVAKTIRTAMRKRRDAKLQQLPSQGRAMKLVSKSKSSSHFIRSGTFTRFVDWRFIHRARLNLLHVNGRPWNPVGAKGCKRCNHEFESLTHVLNHCPQGKPAMMKRHDDIVRRIKTAMGNSKTGCSLLFQDQTIPGDTSRERPDLVFQKGNEIYIIDVTIPFESGEDALKEARDRKKEKYRHLVPLLKRGNVRRVHLDAFVVGSLGSWDPDNEDVMKLFTTKFDKNLFRNLCVSNVIKWSRDIYTEHDTGSRITNFPSASQLI